MAAIGAALDPQGLNVYLIPFDANKQPLDDAAIEFVMERQGTTQSPPAFQLPGLQSGQAQAGAAPVAPSGFSGIFTGNLDGTPTTLTLQQQGGTIQGRMDASGYPYTVNATSSGTDGTARGTFSDPQTGGNAQLEMSLQGNALTLTFMVPDAYGQVNRNTIRFNRQGTAPQGGVSSPGGQGQPGAAGNPGQGQLDSRLVGSWSYSKTMMSGGFSMVTQRFLQVNPDGTYVYGNGRVTAGGEGAYGDTGYGDDAAPGRWRVEGDVLYLSEQGSQWVPYARYYVEGGSLMLTTGDGKRQVWKRR
jgi:hypothetical protein